MCKYSLLGLDVGLDLVGRKGIGGQAAGSQRQSGGGQVSGLHRDGRLGELSETGEETARRAGPVALS